MAWAGERDSEGGGGDCRGGVLLSGLEPPTSHVCFTIHCPFALQLTVRLLTINRPFAELYNKPSPFAERDSEGGGSDCRGVVLLSG